MDGECPAKKIKTDASVSNGVVRKLDDLHGFEMDRVLRSDTDKKSVIVIGKFKGRGDDDADAIVSLEKLPFKNEKLGQNVLNETTKLVQQFQNDVYSAYDGNMSCSGGQHDQDQRHLAG